MSIFDITIIGAGPGGYELALKAAEHGKKVCLIERNYLGGTCLNAGCIPTKTYYHDAKLLHQIRSLSEFSSLQFDFSLAKQRKDKVVTELRNGIEFSLKKANVTILYGEATMFSNTEVRVRDEMITSQYIVIATGSRSRELTITGAKLPHVLTAKALLDLPQVPKSLVVIGGGVIGIEMASIFREFGSEVTIIEASKTILPQLDLEVSRRLTAYLKTAGIKIITNALVQEITETEVRLDSGTISAEYVLSSIGRTPNIEIAKDRLEVSRGIIVNENFQTNIPNIYAIGDVTNQQMLAHYATYAGYRALHHILGIEDQIQFALVPSCIFTFPEIAVLGLTEETCKLDGRNYEVKKAMYRTNGRAYSANETDGFIKLLIEEDTIIGAHIIGSEASVIIHEVLVMMQEKLAFSQLKNYIHAHPTLSEVLASLF